MYIKGGYVWQEFWSNAGVGGLAGASMGGASELAFACRGLLTCPRTGIVPSAGLGYKPLFRMDLEPVGCFIMYQAIEKFDRPGCGEPNVKLGHR